MNETIGFIGLGKLGQPVATNLLNAGYSLVVYNRTESKAEPLVARGAKLAPKPVDAITTGGIVVSLLWDDESLESIASNLDFLKKLGNGGIHISMSTVSPDTSKKLAALHAEHGSFYIDAPILGRPEAAVAKQLWIPYSGSKQAKKQIQPILKAMGAQDIFDFGEEVGAANLVKLVGNFLIISAGRSINEALTIVKKKGYEPKTVLDMLTSTLFPSPIYKSYGNRLAESNITSLQNRIPLKDIGILKKVAQQVDSATPISNTLNELLKIETKES
jgi:3-hydroxyisobutyrate dehydrogenase-like beta-hydroxyacid dehydrogenase